ncbi:unnamed protein product [Caenorhabditis angaria]|uniref:Uncharacterized protein n=1 Tax=Caenorhabditis angaria TaxID=860376 RepID=A0A9P1ITM9_9PELO|nr:unnamed protein product [Caenorhabditis angaria]
MIYISWFHSHIPKVFALLSFLINPLFIYLVVTRSKSQVGNYRYLLVSFAIFDIFYSIAEILTPIAIETTTTWFAVFLTDGPFFDNPIIGQLGISSRCAFISQSYAILVIHFVYRYLLLFKPHLARSFFEPTGIAISTAYFVFQGLSWGAVCETCLSPNDEIRKILLPTFVARHDVDSQNIPMLTAVYWNSTSEVTTRGRVGIGLLTLTSIYSIAIYGILGYKIVINIQEKGGLSKKSLKMQAQLFYALLVQTLIPIVGSFTPTVLAWYAPIFGFDAPTWWNYYICTLPLAAFPFIDPLAVIFFIPNYRIAFVNVLLRRDNISSSVNVVNTTSIRRITETVHPNRSSTSQIN